MKIKILSDLNIVFNAREIIIDYNINHTNDYDFKMIKFVNTNSIKFEYIIESTLYTIFSGADKRYIIHFDNLCFEPYNYDINNDYYGIIDYTKQEIIKKCKYREINIAYSLYGSNENDSVGAIKNTICYNNLFKNPSTIFYIRDDVPNDIRIQLKSLNASLINCLYMPDWYMDLIKILPIENDNNVLYISRNTDNRLNNVIIFYINQWITSNNHLHIINNDTNNTNILINGQWGLKQLFINNIRFIISSWCYNYLKNNLLNKSHCNIDNTFLKYIYDYNLFNYKKIIHYRYFLGNDIFNKYDKFDNIIL